MLHLKSRPEVLLNDRFFPQTFNSMINALMDDKRSIEMAHEFVPSADIKETEQAYLIHLALPGFKKEDIKITLESEMLQVEGELKQETEEQTSKYLKREIHSGRFNRSFRVGKTDTNNIEAAFEHGILTITLPKRAEEKPASIAIK